MKLFSKNNVESVSVKENQIEKNLKMFATMEKEELYKVLDTTKKGLETEKALEKLEEFGTNVIKTGTETGTLSRLREATINPFNLVLFGIAGITFVTDVLISKKPDYLTVSTILFLVFISSVISFVQSERSNNAAEKLSKMISNYVDVFRDGKKVEVTIDQIVVGDLIKLSAGDIIPGDIRFITTKDAFISQASLTGESNPVEKFSVIKDASKSYLTDLENIGFMGSNMVSGTATAIVLTTSNNTYFGSMAKSLSTKRTKNGFERGVDSVSGLLINLMFLMVPVVFLVNGLNKGDWASSLLFAITVAVGLTPEMLPVIMTSTLAKGAVVMSKKKVIVKNLSSIQTFGEMDILCTDKTGTLTEDKIILEKYMDVQGNDDKRILRHAYLNSYFQTGLKNLIDLAVINRGNEDKLNSLQQEYRRIDEIPFDFARRRMSVVLSDGTGKRQLITKGAVEEVLNICKFAEYNGEVLPLDKELYEKSMEVYEKNNKEGLRVVAVAQKNNVSGIEVFGVSDESEMVLLGFIAFLDPPKESSKTAIKALNEHGVKVVVLTGDSEGVAIKVCNKVGVDVSNCITGKSVDEMDDIKLKEEIEKCCLFSKLSPSQKKRIVKLYQDNGHTVGYMGDGINDALALQQSDVGISVDSAVDIAKETANIILLEKDLMVLENGVIEGRKTFGNIIKYLKMATSGNFGNMISIMVASIFLPFLPLLPVHILTQNLLCDFSQMGMPFDDVDCEYIKKPRKWETKSIKTFMITMGPISSIFDIACFCVLWWVVGANKIELAPLFQSGLFVFGTISQVLVVHMIRTQKIPFVQSNASLPLMISTVIVTIVTLIIGFTGVSNLIDLMPLPLNFLVWLLILLVSYCITIQLFKKQYIRFFGDWL